MIRCLHGFNLLGVVALAILCAVQWRNGEQSVHQQQELERLRWEQSHQIAGYVADLEELRSRLSLSETTLRDTDRKLDAATRENNRLAAERVQLKSALARWTAAFAASQKAVGQANDLAKKLISERDHLVRQFNDLAGRYNALARPATRSAMPLPASPAPSRPASP